MDVSGQIADRCSRRALTLIELLLAMTIFAIVAVSIYCVFRTGMQVWFKANAVTGEHQTMRVLLNAMSQDLKNAVAYNGQAANFQGSATEISFMTLIEVAGDQVPEHMELARVDYSFNQDTHTVSRLAATQAQGFDITKAPNQEFALENKGLSFQYCYKNPYASADAPYQWQDTWENQAQIPRGVMLKSGEWAKMIFIPTGHLGIEQ